VFQRGAVDGGHRGQRRKARRSTDRGDWKLAFSANDRETRLGALKISVAVQDGERPSDTDGAGAVIGVAAKAWPQARRA